MSGTVNKVIIVGRLGKDPEIRKTQAGQPIANMSIATEETWKDKTSGERKKRTEWHRVVCFNEKLAEIIEKFVRKGSLVYLEGQLATRKWADNAGVEKYTTEVVLPRFGGTMTMLTSTEGGERPAAAVGTAAGTPPADDNIPF